VIGCTHGMHEAITIPDGDVLIHTGDVSMHSTELDVMKFGNWFANQSHERKICIAGNHDKFMSRRFIPDNVDYLLDSSVVIDGLKFHGSPWTPTFFNWYWTKGRGHEIREKWDLIPDDTNVLITHGPPHGVLDKTAEGDYVGCEELENAIKRVKPTLHCFSHIHEAYGVSDLSDVADMIKPFDQSLISVNASIVTRGMNPINEPIVVEI